MNCAAHLTSELPPADTARRLAKVFAALALAIAALMGLVSCGTAPSASASSGAYVERAEASGGAEARQALPDASPDGTWSVFVYFCGSNLETQAGLATNNIAELLEADIPADVNFVFETGGSNAWQNDVIDPDYLQRYAVEGGKVYLQDQQPRKSMGDPEVLADFLTWGVENYPADHYMVVLWDHGGGSLGGVCLDELDHDVLSLPEIRDGVAAAGVRFDIIGFDTCLMATLETAQLLAPYANYMVASEELEPGGGWAWGDWPSWFSSAKTRDAADLGACICDTYLAKCGQAHVGDTATLSVVDLTRVGEVSAAFASASAGMAEATQSPVPMQRLIQDGRDVESFGHANYLEGYTNMVDLGDLMACMDETVSGAADDVVKAVDSAVVYERHGQYRPKATGLSVFYPISIDHDTFLRYFELSTENDLDNIAYLQFLAVRAGDYDLVEWSDEGVSGLDPIDRTDVEGKIVYSAGINAQGRYEVNVTEGTQWLAVAKCVYGMVLDDGTWVTLGTDNDLDLDIDQKTYAVTWTDRLDGYLAKIDDSYLYTEIVEMVWKGDGPSYNLYSTPVELTTKNAFGLEVTTETNLLSIFDYEAGTLSPVCVYESVDETGMAGKSVQALREGDKLKFLVHREVDGKIVRGSTGTVAWSSDSTMTKAYAGDATYFYMVQIVDVFGNEYMTAPALVTFENGKRTSCELI